MLIHHWVTILLISFSYEAGFHRIGAIIIVVHDISDVFLEVRGHLMLTGSVE